MNRRTFALLLASCFGPLSVAQARSRETPAIGALFDRDTPEGLEAANGAALALKELATRAHVDLFSADSQRKAGVASSKAREWADTEDVTVLLGTNSSVAESGVLQVVRERKLPFISLSRAPDPSKNSDAPGQSPGFIRIAPNPGHYLNLLPSALANSNASRLIVVATKDSQDRTAAIKQSTRGYEVVGVNLTEDFRKFSTQSNPPAVLITDSVDRSAREEIYGKIRNGLGRSARVVLEGSIASASEYDDNTYAVTLYARASEKGEQFFRRYTSEFHSAPVFESGARAYVAMQIILQVLDKSGSRTPEGGQFIDLLRNLQFETLFGDLNFKGNTDCNKFPLAVLRLGSNSIVVSKTSGGACACVDDTCCSNCCKGKGKPCSTSSNCE
jgi:ABC-type branched-subunit amino acid transport system substrate-binding protein